MNKIAIIFLLIFVFGLAYAKHFWAGDEMGLDQVKKTWGCVPLDEELFKKSGEDVRAKMACSILQSKKFIGKSVGEIRERLGAPTGFYYRDIFPAYMIKVGTSPKDTSWQIVFELDKNRKVTGVFVHKNCCYD